MKHRFSLGNTFNQIFLNGLPAKQTLGDVSNAKNCIVWSRWYATKFLRELKYSIQFQEDEIVAICDNDESKCGKKIDTYTIQKTCKPEIPILRRNCNYIIIYQRNKRYP